MKKKMLCLVLLVGLLISGAMTAYATEGTDVTDNDVNSSDSIGSSWQVTYTSGGKVVDNLASRDINDMMSTMQPGDEIKVSVALKNENAVTAHWYMKNNVVKSMEQLDNGGASGAEGGAYSYRLTYYPPVGDPVVLYTSEKVGGEDGNGDTTAGLMELEKDERLQNYFYLSGLANGQSGRVELTVGLDGETQGNSYQAKAANLEMVFAVEPEPQSSSSGGGKTHHRVVKREVVNDEVVYIDEDGVPLARDTDIVKTSDEMMLYPYILAACISGSLLLILAIFGLVNRKKEEEEVL